MGNMAGNDHFVPFHWNVLTNGSGQTFQGESPGEILAKTMPASFSIPKARTAKEAGNTTAVSRGWLKTMQCHSVVFWATYSQQGVLDEKMAGGNVKIQAPVLAWGNHTVQTQVLSYPWTKDFPQAEIQSEIFRDYWKSQNVTLVFILN